jgi:hypothetical protein
MPVLRYPLYTFLNSIPIFRILGHTIIMRLTTSLIGLWCGLMPFAIANHILPACSQNFYSGAINLSWEVDPHFIQFSQEGKLSDLVSAIHASLNSTPTSLNNTTITRATINTTVHGVFGSTCDMKLSTTPGSISVSDLWTLLTTAMSESKLFSYHASNISIHDVEEKRSNKMLSRYVKVLVYRPGSNVFRVPIISYKIICPSTPSTKEELDCTFCDHVREDIDNICKMPGTWKLLGEMGLSSNGVQCMAMNKDGREEYCQ